jgi:hypothetical protein
MYESKTHRPIPRTLFVKRLLRHSVGAFALLLVSLIFGMWGYEHYENLPWRSAFLNSAMLLGGMGPVDPPTTDGGRLFAGFYALYAGLAFLIGAGVIFTPILHRLMHKLHWEEDQ